MVASRKKIVMNDVLEQKLKYIGLDLNKIPKELLQSTKLNFRVIKGTNEKKYKQYKFVNIKDIEILLTPANRSSDLKERYEEAEPLATYISVDSSANAENIVQNTVFFNMFKKLKISEIEKIEKEQEELAKKLPFKIKYNRNYLWQIYYSESADKYFMLVPTDETNFSCLFYLIKKKIENNKNEKIFVPITCADYSGKILKKSELRDLENYLWLLTKDYPSIYEVTDLDGETSLEIIGESQIYGKIKTLYKMNFNTTKEASKFYKLLKALFILQTELPHYYNFVANIDDKCNLKICLNNSEVVYEKLPDFVLKQYVDSVKLKQKAQEEIKVLDIKLNVLKKESAELESEYLAKEKQISTFLECKKSFFGKVKYYFKFGKKNGTSKKIKENHEEQIIEKEEKEEKEDRNLKKKFKLENKRYTLDDLILSYKDLEILENHQKNTVLDINAIKLKNKNLKKKIENATSYINEINKHKKSIFEFWKYSNKDEVKALEEGEEEELNISRIERTFNFDNDFEEFGEKIDKNQRMKFTDSELDSSYISSTDLLYLINLTYKKEAELKDYSTVLKKLKDELDEEEFCGDYEIFGKSDDQTKESNIGSKIHRETSRNQYEILDIVDIAKGSELKKKMVGIVKDLKKAMKKNVLDENIYIYKATSSELNFDEFQTFSLDEEKELKKYLEENKLKKKCNLYKIKLNKGTNFIAYSNIIYYNNINMTLPVGMQLSNKILVDLSGLDLKNTKKNVIEKAFIEDEKDDFSKVIMRNISIHEYEIT